MLTNFKQDWLSLDIVVGLSVGLPSSINKRLRYTISFAASLKTMYSASVVESDTVGCSLLVHAILEFPIL